MLSVTYKPDMLSVVVHEKQALALSANIRIGWQCLIVTNSLACWPREWITVIKSITTQAHVVTPKPSFNQIKRLSWWQGYKTFLFFAPEP